MTYIINHTLFEVNWVLGGGFLEKVHKNALRIELKKEELTLTDRFQ